MFVVGRRLVSAYFKWMRGSSNGVIVWLFMDSQMTHARVTNGSIPMGYAHIFVVFHIFCSVFHSVGLRLSMSMPVLLLLRPVLIEWMNG